MSDLVKRLRDAERSYRLVEAHDLFGEAAKRIESLEAEVKRLRLIRCPDNAGGWHRWDGDGQCKDCCNYATNLIEKALLATGEGHE